MELNINNWGYSFVPIVDIQCMSLGLYKNQLVCVINNGSTYVWSLEKVENFEFGRLLKEQSLEYLEDDRGDSWSLLQFVSLDINTKFSGYIPLHIVGEKVLMLNWSGVQLKLYDLLSGIWKTPILDGLSMLEESCFYLQTIEEFDDFIENENIFSLIANADSIVNIPPLPVDVFN